MTTEWTVTCAPKRARLNGVESVDGVAYCAGDRGVLLERAGPAEWRAVFTVRGVSIPGDGTALTEVVDNDREVFACDESGTLYHTAEGSQVWKRRSLADAPVQAISFNDANLYKVAEYGTVFEKVSLWGEGSRDPRSIDAGVDDAPTEIDTDNRRTIAVVGDGGQLCLSEEGGNFAPVESELEETLYGAEVMDAGTIVAVGDDGLIVEGVPQ